MARSPDKLDGEGDIYHASGLVWRKSFGQSATHAATKEKEVFSACGAAAVYPKTAFDRVGGFDEDYFAYIEDVDLGFRLRLAGVPCIYLPAAVVQHVGSGSTSRGSEISIYYGQRNLVWTFFKDMPAPLLFLLLIPHLFTNLIYLFLYAYRGQVSVAIKAKMDAVLGLEKMLRKRKSVQRQRRISILSLSQTDGLEPVIPAHKTHLSPLTRSGCLLRGAD